MRSQEIRRAIVQARTTQGMSQFLIIEFAFIALFVGARLASLQAGLITFVLLCIGLFIPVVSILIVFVLGTLWALVCLIIAYQEFGLIGGVIIGGFGALISYGIHMGAVIGSYDARI